MRASGDAGVEALYLASYPRLVAMLAAIARDRQEAEEAVQDAFVRLLGRWDQVSRYDDPEAWVRRVALNLLSNRRRKLRNGLRAARRHGVDEDVPGPEPTAVDLSRAVAGLTRQHREVIVLQHLGYTAAEIADALGLSLGTAKSRLARARARLAPRCKPGT